MMILACAAFGSTGGTDWTALAFFGVPILGVILGRVLLGRSAETRRREPPPSSGRMPAFPLATRPELGSEKPADDLVEV